MSSDVKSRPATPMLREILEQPTLLGGIRSTPLPVRLGLAVFALGFLVVNVAIGVLVVSGRLDGHWYDFRDLGNATAALRSWLDDRDLGPWLSYWVTALIGGVGILSFVGGVLLIGTWVERRLLAKFQIRRGPNRVGPFGLLQPLADALKLIQKEVLIPIGADRKLFFLPPILIFIPAMLGWGPVPWAPNMAYLDVNVGLLYVVAISSLAVLAIFIAGWSSNNHYALLGAMRTVAMMVSYEIPVSLSLLSVVLFTGSLQLSEIVAWQSTHNTWLAMILPFSLFTFFFSSTAEINRTPNDIAEAESEIVAGFHTEYSGMKAGLFLAVELGNALLVGALVSTFFLGGYSLFGLEEWIPPYLILFAKISAVYFLFVWLRGTLPRFRLDQLMGYAWKFLIPLSIAFVGISAVEASIFARVDAPGLIVLGAIGIVNVVLTFVLVRAWARVVGYEVPRGEDTRPTLTTAVGGLRAAQRLRVTP
ncbi:MAG: NADH-quinone oxidoreductase subunit NuoH [Chloroflexi bacterium]|nr:NADH-quinone oxidoreductase subunit NuoH [Chloroflexota bacterium]MQC27483.1 NADH-quinone oxidoreductase subunit NuoH [Chloroflexota bacterium]